MEELDVIRLSGLRARGHHGVLDQERRDGQDFVVDLAVWADLRAAGSSDQLSRTIDYSVLAAEVHDIVTGAPVDLIETLAASIAAAVLTHPGVVEVEVTVHKPHAPIAVAFDDVSVTIRRRPQ